MSQPKNWLPDDALEGSDGETRSRTGDDADRPSMEVRRHAPSQPEPIPTALGQKLRRAAMTPMRTWRRLLSTLALPCALGFTVLSASGAAHAHEPPQRWTEPTAPRACGAKTLQSSGYRDMLTRFASRQSARGDARTLSLPSSYRDFTSRLQPARDSGTTSSARARRRYSLRATPSCG